MKRILPRESKPSGCLEVRNHGLRFADASTNRMFCSHQLIRSAGSSTIPPRTRLYTVRATTSICTTGLFSDPKSLSTVYWPRSLRDFLIAVLKVILEKHFAVIEHPKEVEFLLSKLREPTSTYIHIKYRHAALQVLNAITVKQIKLSVKSLLQPSDLNAGASLNKWPTDITCTDDLRSDLGSDSLRNDVLDYLFAFLENADVRGFKISFNPSNAKPITIRCPSNALDRLQSLFGEESQQLAKDIVDEVPVNMIELKASDDCHFVLKEDHLC